MELIYKPQIINVLKDSDAKYLASLKKGAVVFDHLQSQLGELIKMRYPKIKFEKAEEKKEALINEHLLGCSLEDYGLWIYYPWSNKLVHTVTEEEFIELRTIRNKYKITDEEQTELGKKIIGVIGLSVGHSIATTIAAERICGELRLADFDTLELTNMNRIKTGIDKIGMKKTIIAARQIAEMDPFLKVICYHEGINDDNINDFLTLDGNLDVCIEECDGFYEKFNVRYLCKDLKIPVIMETNDKGLIDIERFDLEEDRPIFHGLTTVKDISKLRNLTTDEKIPYLYEILDEKAMSTRLKASLIEVGETITGWPQLSSGVTFGGGMLTDVCRRMLLKQFNSSGRYSIDLDELIRDETDASIESELVAKPISTQDYSVIRSDVAKEEVIIDKATITEIVKDAIAAPSGGNAQPWKWISSGNDLFLFLDNERCSAYTDLYDWGAVLSLGCATENLVLSASKRGYQVLLSIKEKDGDEFGVRFTFFKNNSLSGVEVYDASLERFIKERQTNRNNTAFEKLISGQSSLLINATESIPGASLKLIEDRKVIIDLANLVAEGDVIRFLNKFLYNELMEEIRWNKEEAIQKPYGIELDLFDLSPKDKIGFKIANSWSVAAFVKNIGGKALGDLSRKLLLNSSAVALVTMPEMNKVNFFNGGIAVERFWLTATKHNIAVHPFAALCYFFMRLEINSIDFFSQSEIRTLKALRERWQEIFETPKGYAEIFMAKLSYAPRAEMSQRISVNDVLEFR